MDPLSITVSAVTIVGVSVKAYHFGRRIACAQDEIKGILTKTDEVKRHLRILDEILARLPEEFAILLDSLRTFENYKRKVERTASSVGHLIHGLRPRNSSLRSKAAANIKWTVQGKKAKVKTLTSHLACLREALLTDCTTSLLAEVVDHWLASKRLNKHLEGRM